uniref:Cryptdin related sequence peptide n=1 Tax=Mus musculus TaxID=10090 RepID=Q70LV9_MOUSE|nr:alpha-defensin, related sequence 4 precursor [Mus musculus]CAD92323.1 cryptdin related sequence peptide [Mus musculus]CAD92324.1 cryptdin related sequence peptide [Mus musculus]
MKKLVLLFALVLLAFQVQADSIQNTDEEIKTEEQPGEENQAVSVSFGDPQGSALQDAAVGWGRRCPQCPRCPSCPSCPRCPRCPRCKCNPK